MRADTVRSTTEGSAEGWLKLLADPRRRTPGRGHGHGRSTLFPTYGEILEGPLWKLAAQLSG